MSVKKPDSRDRDAPGVLHAFAIGMVWCPKHGCIHIDLVDEGHSVIATADVGYDQLLQMVAEVDRGTGDG